VEFIGLWETLHNPDFKPVEFDTFRKQAGLNSFNLTPRKWIEATNAIGIFSKSGRYGGYEKNPALRRRRLEQIHKKYRLTKRTKENAYR
jgi:hypothetical protein